MRAAQASPPLNRRPVRAGARRHPVALTAEQVTVSDAADRAAMPGRGGLADVLAHIADLESQLSLSSDGDAARPGPHDAEPCVRAIQQAGACLIRSGI